jgi:hypothetical protein
MDSTSPVGLGRAITSAGRDAGDLATLVGGIARAVGAVVPFDGYCLLTMDPESMLPTGHWMEAGLSDFRRVSENEYLEDDVHKFQDLAGAAEPVGVLGEGRPETGTSSRYADILRPAGFGAELRVVARDAAAAGARWCCCASAAAAASPPKRRGRSPASRAAWRRCCAAVS